MYFVEEGRRIERRKTSGSDWQGCKSSITMAKAFYSIPALVLLLDLVALILTIVAATTSEGRRDPHGDLHGMHCSYDFDAASGMGVAAFALLLASRILSSVFTKCFCCGTDLKLGCAKVWSIIAFVISWITFLIAELFLWVFSWNSSYNVNADLTTCSSLRKAGFWFGAGFVFLTALLSASYSACYKKATL